MFLSLVKRHQSELYRYSVKLTHNVELAEDLLQDTFCEAWRSIPSLRDARKGRGWLFQILRHRFSHWVRDKGRRIKPGASFEEVEEYVSLPWPDVVGRLANQEMVRKALSSLDGRYREPFLKVFRDGLTCKAAAEVLHIPLGTVLSRIHRARQHLRTSIEAMDAEGFSTRGTHSNRRVQQTQPTVVV